MKFNLNHLSSKNFQITSVFLKIYFLDLNFQKAVTYAKNIPKCWITYVGYFDESEYIQKTKRCGIRVYDWEFFHNVLLQKHSAKQTKHNEILCLSFLFSVMSYTILTRINNMSMASFKVTFFHFYLETYSAC